MVSAELRRAVGDLDGPFGVIDRDAFDRNIAALRARAAGLPIRVASKSLRAPHALERVLSAPGYGGILAFSLPEALDLHRLGFRDIVVAYPTVHREGLRALAADAEALAHITLMVDSDEGIDVLLAAYSILARGVPISRFHGWRCRSPPSTAEGADLPLP